MTGLRDFFWFCSGTNISMLKRTPSEHQKYIGIGATVFFTGIFAGIAAAYALFYVFNDLQIYVRILAAIGFGALWGLMIFNLDRYIVSSMKKNGSLWGQLKIALPRFLLAAVIALVISKPLELQIFHTSIEYKLREMEQKQLQKIEALKADRYQEPIATIEKEIAALKGEIETKTVQRNLLEEEARKEADGTGGTGKRGLAQVYQMKKENAQKADQELQQLIAFNTPLITAKQQELDKVRAELEAEQKKVNAGAYDGFDKRLSALGAVTAENPTIAIASWFVMLLFICIEISPILVKLLSYRGPYDDMLESHEKIFEHQRIRKIAVLDTETDIKLKELEIQKELEIEYLKEKLIEKYQNKKRSIQWMG